MDQPATFGDRASADLIERLPGCALAELAVSSDGRWADLQFADGSLVRFDGQPIVAFEAPDKAPDVRSWQVIEAPELRRSETGERLVITTRSRRYQVALAAGGMSLAERRFA